MLPTSKDTALFLISDFISFEDRQSSLQICCRLSTLFTTAPAYQHYLNRLHIESGLYSAARKGLNPKITFKNLYKRRDLWISPPQEEVDDGEDEVSSRQATKS